MTNDSAQSGPTVTFLGAAQSVTGSMHLVQAGGRRVLLDCGLVIGKGDAVRERNRHFPFDPATIDAVLLSHAHVDHCGNLPNLIRQGFAGSIYCTRATRDLVAIMLTDSARIQAEQSRVEAILAADECSTGGLYGRSDVQQTLERCAAVEYDRSVEIAPGLTARFVDAGHLLGSAMIQVTSDNGRPQTLTYTGDLGRHELNFLKPPAPLPASDLILSESTYGGREHQPLEELSRKLEEVVRRTIERGGKVLVPAFSLGRVQLVLHYVETFMRQGRIPQVPIYVDSPLATDIVDVYHRYPEQLTEPIRAEYREPASQAHFIRGRDESKALSTRPGPCILIASGGMCEAGRIMNHLDHNIDDPRATILLVSYQAPGSLGRKLLDRGPSVRFHGKKWNKWAEIVDLNGFSSHAGHSDLLKYFRPLKDRQPKVCLVHGDVAQAEALAGSLRAEGFSDVRIPGRGESVRVG
jgi:metallo-beta-lactamase family protein